MKKLMMLLTLISTVAFGGEVKIHSLELNAKQDWDGDYTIKYRASEETGRAWVEAGIDYEGVDEYYTDEFQFKVAGLSLENGKIVYRNGSTVLACAEMVNTSGLGRFFSGKKRMVKQKYGRKNPCQIKMRLTESTVDTGFDLKDVVVANFYMELN